MSSYKKAFIFALILHVVILSLLSLHIQSKKNIFSVEATNSLQNPVENEKKIDDKVVKAISINEQEVLETVAKLKNERLAQKKAEQAKQQALLKEAQQLQKRRLEEQQRLNKLKQEAARITKERERKILQEKQSLQELAKKKAAEEKRLKDLKTMQLEESKRLADLNKKKLEAEAKAREEAAKLKAQQEAEVARMEALRKSKIQAEVNRYKALIISAISRQWIVPDYADNNLSSQFRIKLAPTGDVLAVELTRSSGDSVLDRSAESAIYKASPLPVPNQEDAFKAFRNISLTVRPESARG